MPILPLYAQTLTAGHPESWHRVTSPGGYETWHFTAIDEAHNLYLTASLSWGSPFLPIYLRRYERYRRKPTRNKPPVPKDHCCASFALYQLDPEGGPPAATRFDLCASTDEFGISKEQSGVHVGANRLTVDAQGKLHLALRGTPWAFTGAGPALLREQTVAVNLVFEPVIPGTSREIELLEGQEPVHRWAVSQPLCRVAGEITIFNAGQARTIALDGRGAHDHAWGVRPLSWDFNLGLRGVILSEHRAVLLRWESPRDVRTRTAGRVVSANGTGTPDVEFATQPDEWTRSGAVRIKLPARLSFGDAVRIEHPRVLGGTLAQATAVYEARLGDQASVALVEVTDWARLRSGLWGRIIGLGIASG